MSKVSIVKSPGKPSDEEVYGMVKKSVDLVGGIESIVKPGQTVTVVRVWGKSMLLFYRNLTADVMRGTTFGVTAQFGSKLAGQFEDKDSGMRGGIRVRAGESVREVILANDLGYLIDAAVA